jgi:Tol biopolymer transport system component
MTSTTTNEKFLVINQRDYYLSTLDGLDSTLLFSGTDSPIEMATLSPDKTQFAYFKDNFIYIQDIETQKATILNKEIIGSAGGNLRWSPDGKKLFMSCANAQQPDMAVCAIDISNGQIEVPINEKNTDEICRTTRPIGILFQDLSSDGTKIIYLCIIITAQGQRTPFAVYIYDILSKATKKLVDSQTLGDVWQFQNALISSDGNFLLLGGADQNYMINTYLLDLKTNDLNQLTHDAAYNFQVTTWGQDGKSFYIHRTSAAPPYIEENFLMDIEGKILSPIDLQGIITR